ncbi:uncharacterized protein [Drosophila pseudoobscura]|uniref:Uncharacterized protein n=1 Tax=Drosophila pseudoobscura pseudoobscura TaxID=46245 RepID=A0A6I8V925_DROPS|nr:uncharacterized protein LOC6903133 [Drosophila pseudoobscura]XP_015036307.2 uncharacterized protein LOC6903133 [Drosophila pseudoobscura]
MSTFKFTESPFNGRKRAHNAELQTNYETPIPAPEWDRIPTADFDTFDGLSNLNAPLDNLSLQERHRTKLTNRKKVLAYQRSHHQRLAELLASQQAAGKCDTSEA